MTSAERTRSEAGWPEPRWSQTETALWHSQAHMPSVKHSELMIVRGSGAYVWDHHGRKLFDAPAALWFCNVGHGRQEIADAVHRQMSKLAAYHTFHRFTNAPAHQLAQRLVSLVPIPDAKVFLTSGGSDSIDTAAKIARRYWSALGKPDKRLIVSRQASYHGLHAFGTSIGGLDANRDGFGELVADTARVATNDPEDFARLLDRVGADKIAALFCEPVIGTGGVVPPAPGYLQRVRELCKERDVLFVADEVITGFGRLGTMFASDRYELRPDAMVVAKGITSGYLPLGAVILSRRVYEPFWTDGSELILRHGMTYSGHASACAAAMTNLDILEREDLVARAGELSLALARCAGALAQHPLVHEVRTGVGLLAGIQMVNTRLAEMAADIALSRGLIVRAITNATLQVSPPFVSTASELDRVCQTLSAIFDELVRTDGQPPEDVATGAL